MSVQLVPARVTGKDAAAGRVRFHDANSTIAAAATALLRAASETIPVSQDELAALPLGAGGQHSVKAQYREGDYPPVPVIAVAVREYLASAPRCSCGRLRVYRNAKCRGCASALAAEIAAKAVPPPDVNPKVRDTDHRENTWETKHGG